jgi:hypothetical protein
LFSSAVTPEIDGVLLAPTNVIGFVAGQNVTFRPGQLSSVGIQPIYDLYGSVTNTTDLVLNGGINVRALGLNVAGLSIGPLVDQKVTNATVGSLNLYSNTFDEYIGSVIARPININFDCAGVTGGGEFQHFNICASTEYIKGGAQVFPDGSIMDEIDVVFCGPHDSHDAPSCSTFFSNYSSRYIDGPDGRTYLTGYPDGLDDPLAFLSNTPGASSTDDGALALLGSLGGQPGLGPFVIPDGASLRSFAVPEPGTVTMLGLGLGALLLAANQRRRRAA